MQFHAPLYKGWREKRKVESCVTLDLAPIGGKRGYVQCIKEESGPAAFARPARIDLLSYNLRMLMNDAVYHIATQWIIAF